MSGNGNMQDVMRILEELQPDSVAEAWQLGHEKGVQETAERMIRAGYSDRDVETATQFSREKIAKLRNGGL